MSSTPSSATPPSSASDRTLPPRRLGRGGFQTHALGLGCMGMSDFYGTTDRRESLATLRAAVDAGIDLLDTADFYGMGHNELLIAEALREIPRDQVQLSVKFGALRAPSGAWLGFDGRPAAVKSSLAYTLQRLGTDHVDIYRLARLDPQVPIEETIGAIQELVEAGHVRHLGLSEVGAETVRRAAQTAPITDLQIEYSLVSRTIEREILPTCRELGIGITAYGVLSRGLLSGSWSPQRSAQAADAGTDFRAILPRFQGENLQKNLTLVAALGELAAELQVTVAQLAIAWVLHRGEDIVPLIGARSRVRLEESLGARSLRLDAATLARIEALVPTGAVAGSRYPQEQMAMLDSEG
ncbi:MAG: aldo/keto reductase [Acidobacteriota bacterium]